MDTLIQESDTNDLKEGAKLTGRVGEYSTKWEVRKREFRISFLLLMENKSAVMGFIIRSMLVIIAVFGPVFRC